MFKTIGIITVIIVSLAGLGGVYYWYNTNIKTPETNTVTTINSDGTKSVAVFDKTIIVKGLESKLKLTTLSATKSNVIKVPETILRWGTNQPYSETRTYEMIGTLEYSYDLHKIDTNSITFVEPDSTTGDGGSCNIPLPPVEARAIVDHQASSVIAQSGGNYLLQLSPFPLSVEEQSNLSQMFDHDLDKLGQERLLQSQVDSEKKIAETEATTFLTTLCNKAKTPKTN